MVWKLEREKLKRRVHGGKGADGEMVRNFLAKLHSNYFRAMWECMTVGRYVYLGHVLSVWGGQNYFFIFLFFMPDLACY